MSEKYISPAEREYIAKAWRNYWANYGECGGDRHAPGEIQKNDLRRITERPGRRKAGPEPAPRL